MQSFNTLLPEKQNCAVALGFFDGVHRGHRKVLGGAAAQRANGLLPVCLTFSESPKAIIGGSSIPFLMTREDKLRVLEKIGVEHVFFTDFRAIMHLSAREFFEKILIDTLRAKQIFCGFNYRFGKNGEGDINDLRELCREVGIGVTVKESVSVDGEQISSSAIRALIADGEIVRANKMLGYRFAVGGDIGSGNHIGTAMGFPTVNIPLTKGIVIPRFGVYASVITVDGKAFRGATNIGVHPTVGANAEPLCETFLLDFQGGDLYGKRAVCELRRFIRPEKRFRSTEELTEQVGKDCQTILSMAL